MKSSPVVMWREQKNIAAQLGKKGTIVHSTLVRVAPRGFGDMAPYVVGIIHMDDGTKTIGQIVDESPEVIRPGQKVQAVLRRLPIEDAESSISYTIKFICI